MSDAHDRDVLATYRALRVAMIPLLLILVVAPVLETFRGQSCVLGSISAYFHTPVRGAFVLSLAGVGSCLIAYKGNDPVEDALLDFAGFMAFLVALVPTTVDTTCVAKYVNVVADTNTADAVRNNVLTLFLMWVVAFGLYRLMPKRVGATSRPGDVSANLPVPLALTKDDQKALKVARLVRLVTLVIVGIQLALFVGLPNTFKDVAHGISAVTMVLAVLGVMLANARGFARATLGQDPPARPWVNRYGVAAMTTVALTVAVILTMHRSQYLILAVELIVILGFVVFWFMQTRELWNYATREQKTQMVDQVLEKTTDGQAPASPAELAPTPRPEANALAETSMSRAEVYRAL